MVQVYLRYEGHERKYRYHHPFFERAPILSSCRVAEPVKVHAVPIHASDGFLAVTHLVQIPKMLWPSEP